MANPQKLGNFVNALFQDASNNIGIGGSPSGSYKLEVTGTAKVSSTLLVGSTLTANDGTFSGSGVDGSLGSVVRISTTNTNGNARNWALVNTFDSYGDLNFRLSTAQGGNALTAGSTVLTLSRTGAATFSSSVTAASSGTGVPAFYAKADSGSNNGTYGFGNNSNYKIRGGSDYGAMLFDTNGAESMRIRSDQNIAINSGGYSFIKLFVKGVDTTSSNYALICNNINDTGLFQVRNDGWLISPTTWNNTSGVAANLGIDSSGNIFKATSSIKYKKDIKPYDKGLDTVLLMNPIYYKSISDFDGDKQFAGFIAEEIEELGLKEFVQYNDETNEPAGLNYGNITAILVKAIQELSQQNQDLKSRLDKAGL